MRTYTITEQNGCRLVRGVVSATDFGVICQNVPKNAVIDAHAARLLGVNFAIGPPEALKALIADPEVLSAARIRVEAAYGAGLSPAAKEWLATGQHGISAMTIFRRLTGQGPVIREEHPHDPDDFGRCRLLLEQVPELRPRLNEMEFSPVWTALVACWDELCDLMDEEAPAWRSGKKAAPRTYDRMKSLGC